jgi:hypothetical protein
MRFPEGGGDVAKVRPRGPELGRQAPRGRGGDDDSHRTNKATSATAALLLLDKAPVEAVAAAGLPDLPLSNGASA